MPAFDPAQLRAIEGSPFEKRTLYRIVPTAYLEAMDEIGPSMRLGGRYNPPGEFGALYLTINTECALSEMVKKVFGNRAALPPLSVGEFQVSLRKVLDLTDKGVLQKLGMAPGLLLDPTDYSVTQELASAARHNGFEGLIVPSAVREDCRNMVVFKDKMLPPSFCILDSQSIQKL